MKPHSPFNLQDLHQAFQKVDRLQGKRIFGSYYRVAFFGSRFGDLDGEEYIYKERPLLKLSEVSHRIEVNTKRGIVHLIYSYYIMCSKQPHSPMQYCVV